MTRRLLICGLVIAALGQVFVGSSIAKSRPLRVAVHRVEIEPGASVDAIASGVDRQLWAVGESGERAVAWRVGVAGEVEARYEFASLAGQRLVRIHAITATDGSLWVVVSAIPDSALGAISEATQVLGHVSASGDVSAVTMAAPGDAGLQLKSPITGLAVSSVGTLWMGTQALFGSGAASQIDITTGTTIALPAEIGTLVGGIAPATNGGMWFDPSHPRPSLVELSATGSLVIRVPLPGRAQITTGILAASDGTLWLGARGYIARVVKLRVKTFRLPYGGAETASSLTGIPAGDLWFFATGNLLGCLSAKGAVTQTQMPFQASALVQVAASRLWALGSIKSTLGTESPGLLYAITVS